MTTPRDLLIVAMDGESGRPADRGSLSLALAGAEVIDLLGVRAVALDGDRVVPGDPPSPDDPLLRAAASSLVRQEPYESVEEWLWRRGRDLSSAYLTAFETEGQLTRQRRRLVSFRAGDVALVAGPSIAGSRTSPFWSLSRRPPGCTASLSARPPRAPRTRRTPRTSPTTRWRRYWPPSTTR
jgi:hypothetical protein